MRSGTAPVSSRRRTRSACIPRTTGASAARQARRRFPDLFGVGARELVRRARIPFAAEDLRGGRKPVATVALDAGFSDRSAFTRRFRWRAGLTPAPYRRRTGPPA